MSPAGNSKGPAGSRGQRPQAEGLRRKEDQEEDEQTHGRTRTSSRRGAGGSKAGPTRPTEPHGSWEEVACGGTVTARETNGQAQIPPRLPVNVPGIARKTTEAQCCVLSEPAENKGLNFKNCYSLNLKDKKKKKTEKIGQIKLQHVFPNACVHRTAGTRGSAPSRGRWGLPAQRAADLSKEGTPPPRKPCQRPRGLTGSTEP